MRVKPSLRAASTVNGGCRARPVLNGTSQPDLLFETSCSFSRCPFRRPPPFSALQNGPTELALYSLTGLANSPFHAEPAHRLLRLPSDCFASVLRRSARSLGSCPDSRGVAGCFGDGLLVPGARGDAPRSHGKHQMRVRSVSSIASSAALALKFRRCAKPAAAAPMRRRLSGSLSRFASAC